MNNTNTWGIVCILCMAVGIIIGALLFSSDRTHEVTNVERVVDTVTVEVHHEPIYITEAPADTVEVVHTDTIYRTPAFVARIDTVVERDTVEVAYAFPQHTFSVALRQGMDSVRVEYVTQTITKYEHPAWYEWAGAVAGGLLAGYAMGSIR